MIIVHYEIHHLRNVLSDTFCFINHYIYSFWLSVDQLERLLSFLFPVYLNVLLFVVYSHTVSLWLLRALIGKFFSFVNLVDDLAFNNTAYKVGLFRNCSRN